MNRNRMWATGLAALLGLSLVACAPPAADEAEDVVSNEAEIAEEEPAFDPETCLQGTWLADNEFMLGALQQFGDEITDVTGQVLLTFEADGTTTTDYQDWLITANNEGIETTILRDGLDTGVYTVGDGVVTIEDTAVGSMILVSVSGTEMPVTPEPVNYIDAAYTCDAGLVVISTPDGDLEMTRV